MKTTTRLLSFAVVLAVAFGVAAGIGTALGIKHHTNNSERDAMAATSRAGDSMSAMSGMSIEVGGLPQGLAVAEGNVRLVSDTTTFERGRTTLFRFRIVDRNGQTVRNFDVEHTKRLHLIVVRSDLADYEHLHPTQAADGSWSIPLRFDDAGVYRVFADFVASGAENMILATDVFVPGRFRPRALPSPATTTSVDGYTVSLSGVPRTGQEGPLTFRISRNGKPVAVQPYLGADGHLVALRQGDLAYLHVHPQEAPGQRGPIVFMTDYPSVGGYRLFLQFKAAGAVHTAAFTEDVR